MPSAAAVITPGGASQTRLQPLGAAAGVQAQQRRFPYPYRALLAICSDLDETPDRTTYLETARFLNTSALTSMGPGVGLEVGNTIYFDMPPDQFAYWNTDDAGRAMVRALIQSGHVDCLHSFGDLATSRGHAARALSELDRHDCRLTVWIDHATAVSNLGSDIMRGQGDVVGSAAFHADLTMAYGIRYASRGRVTSVIGQNTRRRLARIYSPAAPLRSMRTVAKEAAKGLAARAGSAKYLMHRSNDLLRAAQLRNGHSVDEFIRCNPHPRGIETGDTADGIADVLSQRFIDTLVERQGTCILYTHLGKAQDRRRPLPARTCEAFAELAARQAAGDVLVTTTRRVLDFARAAGRAQATLVREGDWTHLYVRTAPTGARPEPLDGLTFYVDDPQRTRIFVDDRERCDVGRNRPDQSGRASVSIPWRRLEFPSL